MSAITIESNNTSSAVPMKGLIESLRRVEADAEALLLATAINTLCITAVTSSCGHEALQAANEIMIASETAIPENTRIAANATGQFIHDNVWNWQ